MSRIPAREIVFIIFDPRLRDDPSALDDPNEQNYDGQDQQNVDEAAQSVGSDHSQEP